MKNYFLYIGFVISLIGHVHAQTLLTDCACYGNDVSVDSIKPDCTAAGGVIAIDKIYRGAKLTSAGCPNPASAATRDETNCCTYDSSNDCQIVLLSTDATVSSFFTDCTGVVTCTKQVTWQGTSGECTGGHMPQTNYMCIDYYCITTADTMGTCDTSGTELSSATLYFYNDNYPSGITHSDCCACVLSATAASATIDLKILDFRLYDSASTCLQSVFVKDGTTVSTHDCATNTAITVTDLLTSTTNSLTVSLKSDATAIGNGQLWMKGVVSSGVMKMTCSAVSLCPDQTTTTAVAATTAASGSSGTDSSNTDEDMLLFGQTVFISALIIAAFSFLFLFAFVCTVVLLYMYKRRKGKGSYNVHQVVGVQPGNTQFKSKNLKKTSSNGQPPPYSAQNSTRAPSSVVVSTGSSGSGSQATNVSQQGALFTYGQFENRNHFYGRRASLTHVDSS